MSFGIGVGDILTISQLVLQTYESCKKSPEQFAELRDQVKSLGDSLKTVRGFIAANDLKPEQKAELSFVIAGFNPILNELNALLKKRKPLETKGLQVWQRWRWPGSQKLAELRSRFSTQLSLLSFCLDLAARAKQHESHKALENKFDAQFAELSLRVESARLPKQPNWQMTPLTHLTGIMIPPFFLGNTPWFGRDTLLHIQHTLRSCDIQFTWDFIRLQTQLGKSPSSIDQDLDLETSKALADFQQTFRDTKSFRYDMLRVVEVYLRAYSEPTSVVRQATKVIILSHLVSYAPTRIKFVTPGFTCAPDEIDTVLGFLRDQMSLMLQRLMRIALSRLLSALEDLCRCGNPADWPALYLSLCTVLSAAESLAVDSYQRESEQTAKRSVREMEETVMFLVLGYLEMTTRGRNPLDLDWSLSRNMALVNNDAAALYVLGRMQRFRESNAAFVDQQSATDYGSGSVTTMTGKMVSKILV